MGVMGGPTLVTFVFHQIIGSRVTEVQHQLPHQWASESEGSGGSRYPCHDHHPHRETRGHIKINLLVFKDEDIKDAVMYQSWCWVVTVYCCTECQDCTLLPYVIHSLQGYLGKLVRSSGTDITLD